MTPLIAESWSDHSPDTLIQALEGEPGVVLLQSTLIHGTMGRYSLVTARPFLVFRSTGSRCECRAGHQRDVQFGNPWSILDSWMARFELLDEAELPLPLGGCFGYWGYGLRTFTEPGLPQTALDDLALPDCHAGFYSSLVAFDHQLDKIWIISTGLTVDGSRDPALARDLADFWRGRLATVPLRRSVISLPAARRSNFLDLAQSNLKQPDFLRRVEKAQRYIRSGDIYQVNLSQRFAASDVPHGWSVYQALASVSPAPFAAYLDADEFQIASSSPELFLRINDAEVRTCPIKGTRPRSDDPTQDVRLGYELQTSSKEVAELVMITDLLRNDLGKICEFGSVQVPELMRLERYRQVQHLMSTVEGMLREGLTHVAAFASCFPGGSITGAPKIRAMEIIDALEPVTRGPYTGALGYLGFNRQTQLSILIRAAVCLKSAAYFHAGAGIVADSDPQAEYEETLAKAGGFFQALQLLDRLAHTPSFADPTAIARVWTKPN